MGHCAMMIPDKLNKLFQHMVFQRYSRKYWLCTLLENWKLDQHQQRNMRPVSAPAGVNFRASLALAGQRRKSKLAAVSSSRTRSTSQPDILAQGSIAEK